MVESDQAYFSCARVPGFLFFSLKRTERTCLLACIDTAENEYSKVDQMAVRPSDRLSCDKHRFKTLENQYCLTAVISIEEIVSPIESQRAEIEETAASLIQLIQYVMLVVLLDRVLSVYATPVPVYRPG